LKAGNCVIRRRILCILLRKHDYDGKIKFAGIGKRCDTDGSNEKFAEICVEKPEGKEIFKCLGINGWIILKWVTLV